MFAYRRKVRQAEEADLGIDNLAAGLANFANPLYSPEQLSGPSTPSTAPANGNDMVLNPELLPPPYSEKYDSSTDEPTYSEVDGPSLAKATAQHKFNAISVYDSPRGLSDTYSTPPKPVPLMAEGGSDDDTPPLPRKMKYVDDKAPPLPTKQKLIDQARPLPDKQSMKL